MAYTPATVQPEFRDAAALQRLSVNRDTDAPLGGLSPIDRPVLPSDRISDKATMMAQEGGRAGAVFMAPWQVMDIENNGQVYQPIGHGLMFHADLLKGTSLAKSINDYHFFSYHSNEALHLSERERQIVMDCLAKIEFELQQGVDKHSKKLISTNIELFLDYCQRFYDRQFITREHTNYGIIEQFEDLLNDYIFGEKLKHNGLPSVSYFADQLHLSANYFGDLVKKETGKSAQEYIQAKVIDMAKEKIFDPGKSMSEVAYELGFKYPQHFTRLFKQRVGVTPNEYRGMN